jgi:hypothetical protein
MQKLANRREAAPLHGCSGSSLEHGHNLGTLFKVMSLFCPITITPAPPVMRLAIGGQVPASPGKPPAGLRRAILSPNNAISPRSNVNADRNLTHFQVETPK